MENSRITICIPTLNRSFYLKKAVESVLSQSFTHFKLVILDNNSTDETRNVVESFNDSRIFYRPSEKRLSLSENLNRAFEYCDDEFLMIFHDDDMLDTHFLEINLDAILQDEKVSLLGSSMKIIDENGNSLPNEQSISKDMYFYKHQYTKEYYNSGIFLPMPTVIYRMSIVNRLNVRFRANVGPNLDQFFWFEMNCDDESYFVLRSQSHYFYRRHVGQQTNWGLQKALLDRITYWFSIKHSLLEVTKSIEEHKRRQFELLYKHDKYQGTRYLFEFYLESYWDTIKLSLSDKVKIMLSKHSMLKIVARFNHSVNSQKNAPARKKSF